MLFRKYSSVIPWIVAFEWQTHLREIRWTSVWKTKYSSASLLLHHRAMRMTQSLRNWVDWVSFLSFSELIGEIWKRIESKDVLKWWACPKIVMRQICYVWLIISILAWCWCEVCCAWIRSCMFCFGFCFSRELFFCFCVSLPNIYSCYTSFNCNQLREKHMVYTCNPLARENWSR